MLLFLLLLWPCVCCLQGRALSLVVLLHGAHILEWSATSNMILEKPLLQSSMYDSNHDPQATALKLHCHPPV
jgi:hypothetical protein